MKTWRCILIVNITIRVFVFIHSKQYYLNLRTQIYCTWNFHFCFSVVKSWKTLIGFGQSRTKLTGYRFHVDFKGTLSSRVNEWRPTDRSRFACYIANSTMFVPYDAISNNYSYFNYNFTIGLTVIITCTSPSMDVIIIGSVGHHLMFAGLTQSDKIKR